MIDLNKFTKQQLIHIMVCYDQYINDYYDIHGRGCTLNISEFIERDYQKIIRSHKKDWFNYQGYEF